MNKELIYLNELLKENDTVVFACSGGPDSMCLFHLLNELKTEKKLKLICAHVNHKQRKESEEEYFFVKQSCEESKKNQLKVSVALHYTNNICAKNEIRKTTIFIIATNNITHLGVTLTKQVKELYNKNFMSLKK